MHCRSTQAACLVLMVISAAVAAQDGFQPSADGPPRTIPLIRGTLWFLPEHCADWSDEQFETAIEAQRDVGFDLLWLLNAASFAASEGRPDTLNTIYRIADAKGMKVIVDLPQGGWYGKNPAEEVIAAATRGAGDLHRRYGDHASFYGWYLNYEINPIRPGDTDESAFWRRVWKAITAECHRLAPGSVVTISPFFLLDEPRRRGFVYLTPEQYAEWWGTTLKETGIDVIMLQDSGEHLAFFTLEQRQPFWAAVARASREAGAQFWLNVESGEADVKDWDEYLALEAEKRIPWRFTPIDWLEQKLQLAARYSDGIVNWGYFPFMDPHRSSSETAFGSTPDQAQAAYAAYKAYYAKTKELIPHANP